MPQPIPQTLNAPAQATLEAWHAMPVSYTHLTLPTKLEV